jgi:pantoate--beta-alanine ligase
MGEKDYQQLLLVQDMAKAFFLKTDIVPCPTLREADGLAMSSRNRRLAPAHRELAPLLFAKLKTASDLESARIELTKAGFEVEYLEEHFGRRFVAAKLGSVRLIDNVIL